MQLVECKVHKSLEVQEPFASVFSAAEGPAEGVFLAFGAPSAGR